MAGFFGFFDYNRLGPGVDKNGPQKKGIVIFFEIYFRKFWKLVLANLLYVLVSLPVVTNGLASAGLTYITRNFAREKHAFIYADFMDTVKKNWKQALVIGLLNLLFGALIFVDIWFFWFDERLIGFIGLTVSFFVLILYTFMKYYIYMMMITFKLTIKQLLKNALLLSFVGLKRNLLISVVLLLFYGIGLLLVFFVPDYITITILLFAYILFFPAFRSFLIQFNIFPIVKKYMIDPYYKEHPGEDREAKLALNIDEDEDVAQEEEQAIFRDRGKEEDDEKTEGEKPKRELPKQYNEQELRRSHYYRRRNQEDDDDTI